MNIITIIQTVGFPIAACVGMAWYVKYITDQHNTQMDKLTDSYQESIAEIKQAVETNTIIMTKLTTQLGMGTTPMLHEVMQEAGKES